MMTNEQLSTLSAVELAAALSAGKVDLVSLVAHLNARKIGESIADCVPLLPLLGEYTGAVMMAQQAIHQRPERAKLSPIRRSKGARTLTIHPPTQDDGKKQWSLTAGRSAWRWIVQHADEILRECEAAEEADGATIAAELVKKMAAAAESAAKK